MNEFTRHLNEFSYSLFPLSAIAWLFFYARLLYRDHMSRQLQITLAALTGAFTSAGIYAGYFVVSRFLKQLDGIVAHDGCLGCAGMVHLPIMWEYKWIMGLATGLIFTASIIILIHQYSPYSKTSFLGTIGFIFISAGLFAIL